MFESGDGKTDDKKEEIDKDSQHQDAGQKP